MDYEGRLAISFYKDLAVIDTEHGVSIVQNTENGRIYVKKTMHVYNKSVYEQLKSANIPGIPHVFLIYEEDDTLTIIEEYISGTTIEEMLASGHQFTEDDISDIMLKLCDILSSVHTLTPPVIHRDIKPSNIMITASGEVVLIDFNAAKLESHGKPEDTTLLGTYGYAAPEQYGFGSSSIQTDIYALGMVMNTLVNGKYERNVTDAGAYSHIIRKCLKMEASERYADIEALRNALIAVNPLQTNLSFSSPASTTSLAPPGFRTGNAWHMLIAVAGYMLGGFLTLTLTTDNAVNSVILWYERIFCFVIFIAAVFFITDYRGIQTNIPLCRSDKPYIRFIGICVFTILLVFVLLLILLIGEAILQTIL